ncbi:MAG: hypothetical protein JNL90_14495 [Planctomycetes bacterium]|nr:hypothetical protein [Planctomycetota bacterium]
MSRRAIRLLAALLLGASLAGWAAVQRGWFGRVGDRRGAGRGEPTVATSRDEAGRSRGDSPDEGAAIEAQRDRAAVPPAAEEGAEDADEFGSGSSSPRPFTLRVIDAESGEALRGVTVSETVAGACEPWLDALGRPFEPLLSEAPFLAHGDSPLQVVPPRGAQLLGRVVVAAPDHEATERRVDWRGGGEWQIALRPAGALHVEVRGAPPEAQLRLRLHESAALQQQESDGRDDGLGPLDATPGTAWIAREPERRLPLFGATATVDALATGRWTVALFDLSLPADAQVAFAEAEVPAGGDGSVVLDYRPPTLPSSVPFAGTLVFDRAWLEAAATSPNFALPIGMRLRQRPHVGLADEPTDWDVLLTPGERPEERRFDARSAVPGALSVEFLGWKSRYRTTLQVPPQGETDFRLEIAAPAEVEVRAIGREGPPDHSIAVAVASRVESAGSTGRPFFAPLFMSGTYEDATLPFRMPSGWIELRGDSPRAGDFGYPLPPPVAPFAPLRQFVAPGRNVIELPIDTLALLELVLRDGDALLPWQSPFRLQVRQGGRDVAPVDRAETSDDGALRASFEGEGRFELTVTGVPGYEAAGPLSIELRRGESIAVELPLPRRR